MRFLADGRSALLNTWQCGFYLASGLDTDAPILSAVLALEQPRHVGCGVPILIGHWWIMPIESTREFVVFDVSDPARPRLSTALSADSSFKPHWISRDPNSDQLVFTAEGPSPAVRLAHFDSTTGTLRWDEPSVNVRAVRWGCPSPGRFGPVARRGKLRRMGRSSRAGESLRRYRAPPHKPRRIHECAHACYQRTLFSVRPIEWSRWQRLGSGRDADASPVASVVAIHDRFQRADADSNPVCNLPLTSGAHTTARTTVFRLAPCKQQGRACTVRRPA